MKKLGLLFCMIAAASPQVQAINFKAPLVSALLVSAQSFNTTHPTYKPTPAVTQYTACLTESRGCTCPPPLLAHGNKPATQPTYMPTPSLTQHADCPSCGGGDHDNLFVTASRQ